MELNAETCNVTRLQWKAHFLQSHCDSPHFIAGDNKWYFQLKRTHAYYDSQWNLYLVKKEKREMPEKFVVTAYVKDGDNQRSFLVSKEITQYETCIWNSSQNTTSFNYQGGDIFGKTLTFFFTFDFFNLSSGVHKSVQTLYNLDDRPCLESLSLDLRKLVDESSSPDVQLTCGGRTFPAHRLILCSRSEVFRAMLQSDMLENREGSVEVPDMDPDAFEVFLRYLYTGKLTELTLNTASPLYEAADKYRLETLMRRCGDFLALNLTLDNACEILVLADAHNDKKLKDVALSYILDENIPGRDEYWLDFCDEYPKLSIEVLNRAYKQSKRT